MKFFLGIDPGLVNIGVGIIAIDEQDDKIHYIQSKTIQTSSKISIGKRLFFINQEIEKILNMSKIDYAGIEKTFINSNAKTSMNLAISRGIIMMNFAKFNIDYAELDANLIKKHISGFGHASKERMKESLKYYLNIPNINQLSEHEIDAISIAVCLKFTINNKIPHKI